MAPSKVESGDANGNRRDNQRYKSASVSAVAFARGADRSQEGEAVVIPEKRRINDKLAEMRGPVVFATGDSVRENDGREVGGG
jgi:hypothetical protein